ncbi:TonB-dependent siderophore receptor [Methylobacillus sp. Pita2]|uniref:TonB-dependent siderophore receptor n=1 Tax=Methylobacillus sp. Pita2 TaxID=3383245 RepID=UPI0038B58952
MQHFDSRRKPLSAAMRVALAFSSVFLLAYASSSQAEPAVQAESVKFYEIAAGSLTGVLNSYAQAAGVILSFDPTLTSGKTSSGFKGSYTIKQGFDLVLRNSGLQVTPAADGGYTLKKVPLGSISSSPDVLPEISVKAVAETTAVTEGTGSYTTKSMSTATKMNLSSRETPQSVSVLTRQQIEDQGLITLDDAVQNITGLIVQKGYYTGDSGGFFSRGFQISNLLLDGLPTSTGANGTFNADNDALDIYDRVEVVRGATGLTTGAGTPSAALNLVRKRPTAEAQSSVTLSAGSWNNFRAVLDASGPLNAAGTLRGRTVVTAQDNDYFYDAAHGRNQQFYGILEADLGDATVAALGIHYRRVDNDGLIPGQPTNADGSFLSGLKRSTNLANDFDYWKQTDVTVFADLTHKFANDWQLKAAAVWKRPEQDMLFSGLSRNSGVLYQNSQSYRLDNKQDSYDASLNGPFTLFGRSHELMLGANYRKYDNKNWGGWASYSWSTSAPVVDPYNWSSSSVAEPGINMSLWEIDTTTRQKGAYAVTRLNIADSLKVILGARSNWYENQNHLNHSEYKVTREITPYAGIIYDVNEAHSVYASWTEIFEPQSSVDKSGNLLEPITGTNYEIGVKGEYFGGRLHANLATFIVKQQNRAVNDLSGPNPCPGSTGGYCQRASGEVESKGVELEVSGALTPNLQVMTGYTYVAAKYTKDDDPDNIGRLYNSNLPRHQFKLMTNYRLPGELSRWRVGGSVYAQNSIKANDDPRIQQSAYAIVGLNGSYTLNEKTEFRLNINNLFDKYYYQTIGWGTGGNVFGTPRSVLLTARYRF